jgi:hypothetical protein
MPLVGELGAEVQWDGLGRSESRGVLEQRVVEQAQYVADGDGLAGDAAEPAERERRRAAVIQRRVDAAAERDVRAQTRVARRAPPVPTAGSVRRRG